MTAYWLIGGSRTAQSSRLILLELCGDQFCSGVCVYVWIEQSLLDLAVSIGRARAELVIWGLVGDKSRFDATNASRFTWNTGYGASMCGSFLGYTLRTKLSPKVS